MAGNLSFHTSTLTFGGAPTPKRNNLQELDKLKRSNSQQPQLSFDSHASKAFYDFMLDHASQSHLALKNQISQPDFTDFASKKP